MPIGLIAGRGRFPLVALRAARRAGHDVAIVAVAGEATADLESLAHDLGGATVDWLHPGELGSCIDVLRGRGVSHALMAGQVRHTSIFGDVAPDPLLSGVLAQVPTWTADALLLGVVEALAAHGITVVDSLALLPDLVAAPGVLSRARPTAAMAADFEFGYGVADAVAGADVGQTVIVKDRATVAVEAMEGTDAAIRRAGSLAGAGSRVVKVAKPAQDVRFDVPVVGLDTVAAMREAGADAISIDAGRTLVVDGADFFRAADEAGLVVVGRPRTWS